jgi:hypothetical protein
VQRTNVPIPWRQLLLALLCAGTAPAGTTVYTAGRTLTDPSATFTYWTQLPDGRLLWLSKRLACSPALVPMVCASEGRIAVSRLIVMYYPPVSSLLEHMIRLP